MSRGARGKALVAGSFVLVALAVGGASIARRRARHAAPAVASTVVATGPTPVDATWCGKPLGSKAVGLLRDPASCSKISLTGTAPTCFFWADCGELHFEIDCAGAGPGQCRCDGTEGPAVSYSATFCTLDPAQPGAGLRAVLASAATACKWAPR